MGISPSSLTPECVCDNELLPREEYMECEAHWIESNQKFCSTCKRILKTPKKPQESSFRKHQSFKDAQLQRTESASSVYLSSSKSLPLVNRNGHLVSSPQESPLFCKRHSIVANSPSTPPKKSINSFGRSPPSLLSNIVSPTSPITRNEAKFSSPKNASLEHYSLQTKIARSSSKNLMLLGASGGKLPDQVTTPIPIVKVKKKPSYGSLNVILPPLSPPQLEKLEAPPIEDVQKIAVNLGNAFPNHGTRSFPIYVIPPQEAPELINAKGKKLADHRTQMEEKHSKRRVKRVVVQ